MILEVSIPGPRCNAAKKRRSVEFALSWNTSTTSPLLLISPPPHPTQPNYPVLVPLPHNIYIPPSSSTYANATGAFKRLATPQQHQHVVRPPTQYHRVEILPSTQTAISGICVVLVGWRIISEDVCRLEHVTVGGCWRVRMRFGGNMWMALVVILELNRWSLLRHWRRSDLI